MATPEDSLSNAAVPLGYWPNGVSIRRRASWLDWAYLVLALLCAAVAVSAVTLRPGHPNWGFEWELVNHLGEFADGLGLTLFTLGLAEVLWAEVLWVGRKRCPAVILAGTWLSGLTLAFLLLSGAAFPRMNYA
jgi:hypothetical protein